MSLPEISIYENSCACTSASHSFDALLDINRVAPIASPAILSACVKSVAPELMDNIGAEGFISGVKNILVKVWEGIVTLLKKIFDGIKSVFGYFFNTARSIKSDSDNLDKKLKNAYEPTEIAVEKSSDDTPYIVGGKIIPVTDASYFVKDGRVNNLTPLGIEAIADTICNPPFMSLLSGFVEDYKSTYKVIPLVDESDYLRLKEEGEKLASAFDKEVHRQKGLVMLKTGNAAIPLTNCPGDLLFLVTKREEGIPSVIRFNAQGNADEKKTYYIKAFDLENAKMFNLMIGRAAECLLELRKSEKSFNGAMDTILDITKSISMAVGYLNEPSSEANDALKKINHTIIGLKDSVSGCFFNFYRIMTLMLSASRKVAYDMYLACVAAN